jgi:hypothetical protein
MWLARATKRHGIVQGLIGKKVVSQMVDNVIVAIFFDQPEFYVLEVSHFQGLYCSLTPEMQDSDVQSHSNYYKGRV